jgi:glycosyltransferase involved in cell wall biosynthesis
VRLILTIAGLAPEFGGPSRSVPTLATALARAGSEVELITCAAPAGGSAPLLPLADLVKTHLVPARCRTTQWLARTNGFTATLRARCRAPAKCVIHDNGLWLPNNHAVAFAARALGLPLISSVRGMLSDWALGYKGFKKRLAWAFYQRRDLQNARVLHATSRHEAEEFRARGLRKPVAIVPNGVDLAPEVVRQSSGPTRHALCLSRVHPLKGLLDLVEAWGHLCPSDWQLLIAGQDESGYSKRLLQEITRRALSGRVVVRGPVEGKTKAKLYQEADLFVLPSYSENFGLVVAEALASGVPVITTRGTPWEELTTHRCGWWVDVGAQSLADALREAVSRTDEERREMGRRGRQLIEQRYTWSAAAQKMLAVYEWMLERGPKPEWVVSPEDHA